MRGTYRTRSVDHSLNASTAYAVRHAMKTSRLSQVRAGELLGLSQAAISRRLSGKVAWRSNELRTLAGALAVEPGDLLEPPALLVDESAVAS